MLVKILNFGSNWWSRFVRNPEGAYCFSAYAAHYNSTGVRCGSKVRRHWITPGLLRINGVVHFTPSLPESAIGKTFLCADVTYAFGGNRLLFQNKGPKSAVPDCYLVVVSSGVHGRIDFNSNVWKSALAQVVAASQLRNMQEVMLLMKPGDWVQTSAGFWQLNVPFVNNEPAGLVRLGKSLSV
ncbi:MAG: hypothetical protein DMG60_22810 [Acidobacteria bacterium]|nr:MAG: hypothetical protein DMG60_22810 [Acidobacteriota bacterium]